MSRTHIDEIRGLYIKKFPIGWIDAYDWSTDTNSQESFEKIKDILDSFDQDVFYIFSQSILSGEYLIKNYLPQQLDSLYDILSSGEQFYNGNNKVRTYTTNIYNGLIYELEHVVNRYHYFLTILNNKYSEYQTNFIINAYREEKSKIANSKFAEFYHILSEVSLIDHLLSYDRSTISNLILYHAELERGIDDRNIEPKNILVLKILNEKCLFLLKKLLIEDNKEFDFLIDFKPYHYDTSTLHFEFFSSMDRNFEFYRTDDYTNESLGRELDKRAYDGTLSIGGYALLMKYYKDCKKTSESQIDNIIKEFNNRYLDLWGKFTIRPLDRYALNSLKNYMYNCRFSYRIKKDNYSFEELETDLDEINSLQSHTGILNYYPYRKAFKKAESLFNDNEDITIARLNEYRSFLQLCINKFSEAIEWCRSMSFYPIQLPYRECLVGIRIFGAVFIASSYCRPVKYEKLKDELASYKNRLLAIDNKIALRKEKRELKEIKADIDSSRTKEVEILSFFTAIITFLFGTIGFFTQDTHNDFLHLIYSIFGLGAILLIFVSGIHMVTVRREKRIRDYFNHPRLWFCIITIICCIGLLIWLIGSVNKMK